MDDPMKTSPVFSPDWGETFTVGERVYAPALGHEATYLGWEGTDEHAPVAAFVEWDNHSVTREPFSEIRNLYR